ncbi:hypothetical protein SPHFLASMR4Y_02442 [Sphingorhabdus sp. SMR4y]|nr:hypothetical protein SPHFLASMR4Y_02442 [Sphingorhabdus sp. SMR4y]
MRLGSITLERNGSSAGPVDSWVGLPSAIMMVPQHCELLMRMDLHG